VGPLVIPVITIGCVHTGTRRFLALFLPSLIHALFPPPVSPPSSEVDGLPQCERIVSNMMMCVFNPSHRSYRRLAPWSLVQDKVGPYLCSIVCCRSKKPAVVGESLTSVGATEVFSNAHHVQIAGSSVTVAGRDIVHNHHHPTPLTDKLWAVLQLIPNFRKIYHDMLSKATEGTGLWLLKGDKFRIWIEPNGDIKIFWGSGMRRLPLHVPTLARR
jgi:hypothetical protein